MTVELQKNLEDELGTKLLKSIEMFRDIDPEIPSQTVAIFLTVANQATPIKMSEIAKKLSVAQSSVSRNISYLGKINRHHKPGLGLLDTFEDPEERRRKLVMLTPKGQQFFMRVKQALI